MHCQPEVGITSVGFGKELSFMDNVPGSEVKKRGKVVDMLLLLGTALLVAGLSTGAALVSEAYHVSPAWLLAFWAGVASGRPTESESSSQHASPRSQLPGW